MIARTLAAAGLALILTAPAQAQSFLFPSPDSGDDIPSAEEREHNLALAEECYGAITTAHGWSVVGEMMETIPECRELTRARLPVGHPNRPEDFGGRTGVTEPGPLDVTPD